MADRVCGDGIEKCSTENLRSSFATELLRVDSKTVGEPRLSSLAKLRDVVSTPKSSFQITSVTVQAARSPTNHLFIEETGHAKNVANLVKQGQEQQCVSESISLNKDRDVSSTSVPPMDDKLVLATHAPATTSASKSDIPNAANGPIDIGSGSGTGSSVGSSGPSNVCGTVSNSTSTDETASTAALTEQWQRRFKVVKIVNSEPFRRGRWNCTDYLPPEDGGGTSSQPDNPPEHTVLSAPATATRIIATKPHPATVTPALSVDQPGAAVSTAAPVTVSEPVAQPVIQSVAQPNPISDSSTRDPSSQRTDLPAALATSSLVLTSPVKTSQTRLIPSVDEALKPSIEACTGGVVQATLSSVTSSNMAVVGNTAAVGAQTLAIASNPTASVAIDNKIEQAMDLVKSHLMYAVREEVDVLRERITELLERIAQLEYENNLLKSYATPDVLARLQATTRQPAAAPTSLTTPPVSVAQPALVPLQQQQHPVLTQQHSGAAAQQHASAVQPQTQPVVLQQQQHVAMQQHRAVVSQPQVPVQHGSIQQQPQQQHPSLTQQHPVSAQSQQPSLGAQQPSLGAQQQQHPSLTQQQPVSVQSQQPQLGAQQQQQPNPVVSQQQQQQHIAQTLHSQAPAVQKPQSQVLQQPQQQQQQQHVVQQPTSQLQHHAPTPAVAVIQQQQQQPTVAVTRTIGTSVPLSTTSAAPPAVVQNVGVKPT